MKVICILITIGLAICSPTIANVCEGMNGGPGDVDGDGFQPLDDCSPDDSGLWTPPGDVQNLRFDDQQTLVWDSAADPGGTRPVVYNLYRSGSVIFTSADCFDPVVELTTASDFGSPSSGQLFHYLAQAQNDCEGGSVGVDSSGIPRPSLQCDCSTLCDDGNSCTENRCSNGVCENPNIAPTIFQGPQSGAACAGAGDTRFYVTATGNGPLSYQWLQDGNPVGIDSPVLHLPTASCASGECKLSVVVTDGCSSATSEEATLNVFANAASCAGGLDGFEAPNRAGSGLGIIDIAKKRRSGVHMHSGEYVRTEIDLVVPGRGMDFVWARSYRSRELLPPDSVQGRQWMHGYDRRVDIDPLIPGNLLLIDGNSARVDSYQPDPVQPNCWVKEGFFQQICLQPDNKFVLTFADRLQWIFQPLAPVPGVTSPGRIEAAVDRNNNAMFFQYNPGDGRLTTIFDTLNRPYQLIYNPDGLVETLVDFTGRACTYDYYEDGDAGGSAADLKSVTTPVVTGTPHGNDFPNGKTTTYTYSTGFADDQLNHDLLTITDPNEQTYVHIEYRPTDVISDAGYDRVDRIRLLDDEIQFMYVVLPPDPAFPQIVSTTIVNDRAGDVTHYAYDSLSRLVRTVEFSGRADATDPTDATTNRPGPPLRPSDPLQFETSYQYNSQFLRSSIQFPNGNSTQLVFDEFHPDPRLRANLLQRTRNPGPLGGDQPSITESWGYTTDFGTRSDSQDDGVIRDFDWTQVDGPFKFATQTAGLTKDRKQMMQWYTAEQASDPTPTGGPNSERRH